MTLFPPVQPVRFKLNHNSTRLMPGEKDHSIWVGDLTPDVDDLMLYKFFSARFHSVRSAKGEGGNDRFRTHFFLKIKHSARVDQGPAQGRC